MEINQVTYRRKFNLGNYESVDVELVAVVQPEEDAQEVLDKLAREAKNWRNGKRRQPELDLGTEATA